MILPNYFYVVIYKWHWSNRAETFMKHSWTKQSWTNVTLSGKYKFQPINSRNFVYSRVFQSILHQILCMHCIPKKGKRKKNQWWKNIKVSKVFLIKSCGCLFLWNIIWSFDWFGPVEQFTIHEFLILFTTVLSSI